jgi:hypothetical protein
MPESGGRASDRSLPRRCMVEESRQNALVHTVFSA